MTTQLMQAVWYERQGKAQDVLQYGEMPIPEPGIGEVRVRLHASGVNPSDTKVRGGWGGIAMSFPRVIPHQDGAGTIDRVGEGVPESRIGERVWVYEAQQRRPFGTAAEYTIVPAQQAIFLPDRVSFSEGACLGVPAMTAHRCVFVDGSVKEQTVLVTGGAGAVGNYAVQLAKWGGATVITTVSRPEQAEIAKAAGADYIINYKTEDVVRRIREIIGREKGLNRIVDVDFAANLPIAEATLRTNGAIAMYAVPHPDIQPVVPILSLMQRNITIRTILVYTMPTEAKQAAIRDLTATLEAGALTHNIARSFPLTDVAAAHEAQDSGKTIGKVIIEIA
jgi:NADPH2:quinone reductase